MARYYEEETLFQSAKDGLLKYFSDSFVYTSAELFHKVLANTPTADVVPKSEVAREIFEEIEKAVEDAEIEWGTVYGVKLCIAELKKKYTEDQKDG